MRPAVPEGLASAFLPPPRRTALCSRPSARLAQSGETPTATPDAGDGLTPVRSLLPRIGITTQTLRRLEAIKLVREQRESRTQEVSYNARPFVLCGLPLRQPPKDQLVYVRRNGKFLLEITVHPRFGLPFGQDRLIPIWIATLAQKQQNRAIYFESPTQLLEYFRLRKDGAQYRRIRGGFQRVFAATIFFGTESEFAKRVVVDSARFHFMDSMRLWFNRSGDPEPPQDGSAGNLATLSEAFYAEITTHPIPMEREVIAALAHAPGLLDFYVWIAWKSGALNGQAARIPIFGVNGLTQQLGTAQYSADRLFRHKINHWLRAVKVLWPQCPAQVSDDGRYLVVRSSRKSTALQPVERPVNL
jgi:hypothetical protein